MSDTDTKRRDDPIRDAKVTSAGEDTGPVPARLGTAPEPTDDGVEKPGADIGITGLDSRRAAAESRSETIKRQ